MPNANLQCEKRKLVRSNAGAAKRDGPAGVLNMSASSSLPCRNAEQGQSPKGKSIVFESKWLFQSSKWRITGVK